MSTAPTAERWKVLDKKADKVVKVCYYCGKLLAPGVGGRRSHVTTCAEHADLRALDPMLSLRKNGHRGDH